MRGTNKAQAMSAANLGRSAFKFNQKESKDKKKTKKFSLDNYDKKKKR